METPLLLSKRSAAAALGISLRTLETLISVKELKSVRIGRRRLIPRCELERFARRDHLTRSGDLILPANDFFRQTTPPRRWRTKSEDRIIRANTIPARENKA
jgi:excisionase family DNA binding protein